MVAPSPALLTALWRVTPHDPSEHGTVHSWQTPSTHTCSAEHAWLESHVASHVPGQPQTFCCPPPPQVCGAAHVAGPQETVPLPSQPFAIEPQFMCDGQEVRG